MLKRAFIFISTVLIVMNITGCSDGQDVSNVSDITSSSSVTVSSKETVSDTLVSSNTPVSSHSSNSNPIIHNPISNEFNGVWFSYFELTDMIKGKSEEMFTEKIRTAFKNIADLGLDAVIMHVRPSSDAFYESNIFPWSVYVSSAQGVSPGYDPLKIMIEEAHKVNLQVHAWINPLRVGSVKNFSSFADTNPAKMWLTDQIEENDDWVKEVSGGYYYNPTVKEVRQLIIDGVTEIIDKYDIDGFQFDDYFYPTTNASFDQRQYDIYKESNTKNAMSRTEWRMDQVNQLVKGVYNAIKAKNPDIIFGISPSSNIEHNTDVLYADIHTWLSTAGYVDYICPQIYFGFEHSDIEAQYHNRLSQWSCLPKSDKVMLIIGLAPYKIGTTDGNSQEWITSGNILKREIETGRNDKNVNGFLFYSYTYLFSNKELNQKELNNIKGLF